MEIKSFSPKLGEHQKTRELRCSTSNMQRYRRDENVHSPYRIPSSSHKRREKTSNEKINRPQMTLNGLKGPQLTSKTHREIVDSTSKPSKIKTK